MNLKISLLLPIFVFFLFSCGDDETGSDAEYDSTKVVSDENSTENDKFSEEVSVVCLWKAVSLKETPDSKGKYVTTIYLGEVAKSFGETVTDSSTSKTRDYVKIELGDGAEVWIPNHLMAVEAVSSVINSKKKLY